MVPPSDSSAWLPLARTHAPIFLQRLWWREREGRYDPHDYITPVDFKGWDRVTDNYRLVAGSEDADFRAAVYCWGCATASHFYLGYAVYHPFDWCSDFWRIVRAARVADEHPHDMEGVVLMIPRYPDPQRPNPVETAFVIYHWDIIPYVWKTSIRVAKLVNRPDKTLRMRGPRVAPYFYIHPGSHAIVCQGAESDYSRWRSQADKGELVEGMVYRAADNATAAYPDSRASRKLQQVGYELVDIAGPDSLYSRRCDGKVYLKRDDSGKYTFAHRDERTDRIVAGAATPAWFWRSVNDPKSATGQLFYDPAAFAGRYLKGRGGRPWTGTGPRMAYTWRSVADTQFKCPGGTV